MVFYVSVRASDSNSATPSSITDLALAFAQTWLKREGQKDLYVEGRSANMTVKEGKRRDW